ncbi:MAG: ClbS/DfsB family four-helix bundle protein [Treponema sp.]|uniref:ClbS/DfsB family four-helix bundle protein n=1 Tax=Treponema sp. TaxID=166 RepID=UPI00298DF2CD|nr:ClbS/DfsB family four-helix bundle protein [Treponema sp.]MBR5933501.1 ClbS/DfsB family four-helix bundle protein [Treponema sp.]
MPRPKTKEDLIKASDENYKALLNMIDEMSEKELNTPFDFSGQPNKKEAHWKRDKNVRDILIHLYEWHMLLLNFPKNNAKVKDKKTATAFLPVEYSWKTYGDMNMMFWRRHQKTSLESARALFASSHAAVMKLIKKYSDEELFTKAYFPWTGNASLGSFCISNTSSHYDWAMKKIKAHKKNCKSKK